MNKNDIKIRLERKEEHRAVENLVREAFWNVYRPGCTEHYVLRKMRNHPDFIPELNYVMEKDGKIMGQNVVVRAGICADASFFLCKELEKGYIVGIFGEYATPGCYLVDEDEVEKFDKAFFVNFHVDCNEDVYGIHFEYYLDGTPAGGGQVGNADGSRIAKNDVLVKDFIFKDFPENAELSQFQLEIFVVDKNGDEYPCDSILNIATAYGKIYAISITGSYEVGFSVKQIS